MNKIPQEYLSNYDFGFSAVDDIPQAQVEPQPNPWSTGPQPIIDDIEGINDNIVRIEQKMDTMMAVINGLNMKLSNLDDEFDVVKSTTEQEIRGKLVEVEKLIMPLLVNLLKTADKEYIRWPNRQEKIQIQIDKLLEITRS
jgi:hypothetical protein